MRIRTLMTTTALAVGAVAATALPAAAGELCYDVQADINGQVVSESGCEELPV